MSGISSGRDQDQALHLSPDEVGNELAFALRVLCGVTEKNAPAILCGNLLDAERKVAIVGISEVRDGDTHEAARLPRPQAPRVLVAVIAERANRFEHTLLDLWPNILAARDGARNRHGAHPGQRSSSVCSKRFARSAITATRTRGACGRGSRAASWVSPSRTSEIPTMATLRSASRRLPHSMAGAFFSVTPQRTRSANASSLPTSSGDRWRA